ncbi:hypothetical protein [Priestia taiwanensis]|uniref:LPXTG cell wall anchor domain-containing protein n=1 Tax=Priestia taiwanensis TaxID=1347902 RepID=A0A917EQY5_9BACI|nr:hypothetical protein [Priestia taiwanensis]MBM7363400.1 hypothetical protein [Priestia taiwanensis]GGE77464.1 hypothetical protein GCM10007140_28910 [Priestia taiwanensis]
MKKRKAVMLFLSIYLVVASVFGIFFQVNEAGATKLNVDLNLSGVDKDGVLFKAENWKPGDWMTRTLKVQNNGSENILYMMKIEDIVDDKGLLKEYNLKISDRNGIIFNERVTTSKEFPLRPLKLGASEDLTFRVDFIESNQNQNYLQKAAGAVKFVFYAKADLTNPTDPTTPPDGNNEPDSGGNKPKPDKGKGSMTNLPATGEVETYLPFIGGTLITAAFIWLLVLLLYRKYKNEPAEQE